MEHSPEFERIKRLYFAHRLTLAGLENAVAKGVIQQWEMDELLQENTNA